VGAVSRAPGLGDSGPRPTWEEPVVYTRGDWCGLHSVAIAYIESGSPWQTLASLLCGRNGIETRCFVRPRVCNMSVDWPMPALQGSARARNYPSVFAG
jgi:hypothetical protein